MKLMPRRGEMQEEAKEKKKRTKGDIASLVILIVLAVILVPIFAINLTLIIKGSIDPDVPPDVFGVAPMAVTTGSMDGDEADSFAEGALIFVRILDEEEKQALQEGDIVTFRTNGAYVTHRIVTVNTVDGAVVSVTTKGDANSANDGAILLENVVGLCTGSVAGMGSFAMFLQTPVGIVVVIGIPVLLYIAYDVTRITLNNRRIKAEEGTVRWEWWTCYYEGGAIGTPATKNAGTVTDYLSVDIDDIIAEGHSVQGLDRTTGLVCRYLSSYTTVIVV